MNANFVVRITWHNNEWTPWNGLEQHQTIEAMFETWEDACEFAKKIKKSWVNFALEYGYQMGTWNTPNSTHWGIVKDGVLHTDIEIAPTPDDLSEGLPW